MIKKYEEGDIRAEWKNNIEGYKVDYSDLHGFSLFAFLQSPSEEDISKMSKDADIVIYFDDMDGVGFFTFSFDGTGGSAAFAPSLNLDYPKFNIPDGLSGFPFNIYVIDSTTGKIKSLRSITGISLSLAIHRYHCVNLKRYPFSAGHQTVPVVRHGTFLYTEQPAEDVMRKNTFYILPFRS